MAKYKGHYYAQKGTKWNEIAKDQASVLDITPPLRLQDQALKVFEDWKSRFNDEWINNVASINANNSIAQYNEYILSRLSYAECSHLACDTIINNALEKFTNSIISKWGEIVIPKTYDSEDLDAQSLIEKIEERAKEIDLRKKVRDLIHMSLTYGKGSIFIDVNSDELDKQLIKKTNVFTQNKIQNLQIVPPYTMGAVRVETTNVLDKNYMRPQMWYIQGAGNVDSSRLIDLVMFDTPLLIRPMYNFGGIALSQFMKNYVATADATRQSLGDIMLRFKTNVIKTDLLKVNPTEANERAQSINRQRNNLGTLLLTSQEDYVETITPITGLESISAHQMQYISVAGRLPANVLFGITPSGLNATGEYEIENYNKETQNLQNSKVKPIVEELLYLICLEMGYNIKPEFKFEELSKKSELEEAQISQTYADIAFRSIESGMMTQEQAIDYLVSKEVYPDTFTLEIEESDMDLDMDLGTE